jgi:PhnB protein
MSLRDDLIATERRLWSGGKSAYRSELDENCLVAFTRMAGVSGREEIAAEVDESQRWQDLRIAVEGFLQPTDDVAILTYRANAVRAGSPYAALVSSGYVRRGAEWKLMFHQQTPVCEAEEEGDRESGAAGGSDQEEIRGVLADFTRALYEKDAEAAIEELSDDEVSFDLAPPLRMGPDETHDPAHLREWFDTWKSPIVSESRDLRISVSGDLAYAYGLQHLTGTKRDGEQVDLWFRATACFRRDAGRRWRITHMHNSVPFAMDGSDRALLDLKP